MVRLFIKMQNSSRLRMEPCGIADDDTRHGLAGFLLRTARWNLFDT